MLSGKLIKNECIWEEGNWREPGGRSKKKQTKKQKEESCKYDVNNVPLVEERHYLNFV